MRIVNFLSNPELWEDSDILLPLAGSRIHGDLIGENQVQIRAALQKHFNVSKSVKLDAKYGVSQVVEEARTQLKKYFDVTNVTVFVGGIEESEQFCNNNLGGVSGYAWPNSVFLYLNPNREWQKLLFSTALHEFNHCQRYLYSDPYNSFLDWLVFEGLAQAFEFEVAQNPIDSRVEDQNAILHLPLIKKFWRGMPPDAHEWFFGSPTKKIPFALGYHVGHLLVKNFRKQNPELLWQELIQLPSEAFI